MLTTMSINTGFAPVHTVSEKAELALIRAGLSGHHDPATPIPFSPRRHPTHTTMMGLVLFLVLAMLAVNTNTLAAGEPDAEADPTIGLGIPPWQGAEVKSAVVAEILEGLGYRVETTSAAAPLVFQELAEGRLDINLSAWVPGQDQAFQPYVDEGRIEILGENLAGALTGLAVPASLRDEGLTSLEELDAMRGRFDATIHCIEPGSGAMIVAGDAVDNNVYGLGDWDLLPSSTQAMLAQVGRAIRRGEPIVFCAWKPHWMTVAHDLHFLDDPRNHWGEAGETRVLTLARRGFRSDHPGLARLLERFRVDSTVQSGWIHAYAREDRPAGEVARTWLADHPGIIREWLAGLESVDGTDASTALDAHLAGASRE